MREAQKIIRRKTVISDNNKSESSAFLPLEAQAEILERLFDQMFLDKKDIDEITERHGVCGDIETLQRSYRRQRAQRFIASLRDDNGDRLAMSVKGGRYVLIDYSNDKRGLSALHERLYAQMRGLERSDTKVKDRIERLKRMIARFTRGGGTD